VSAQAHTRPHACVRLCVCVCLRVCAVPLCCWWLGFRIVSRLSVINVPGRVGPKRYITNRRGGRVHRGRKRTQQVGAREERSGKRNAEEEKGDGEERGGSIGEGKKKGGQGLLSPGSCYVSHYVSPGHRQHASRQNKRVSLAWHGSYFPILGTGSGRGQAAGWGAGGIVGSGLASKTQRPRVQVPAESNQGEIWECHSCSQQRCSVAQLFLRLSCPTFLFVVACSPPPPPYVF